VLSKERAKSPSIGPELQVERQAGAGVPLPVEGQWAGWEPASSSELTCHCSSLGSPGSRALTVAEAPASHKEERPARRPAGHWQAPSKSHPTRLRKWQMVELGRMRVITIPLETCAYALVHSAHVPPFHDKKFAIMSMPCSVMNDSG
jgi:hypothetical protein